MNTTPAAVDFLREYGRAVVTGGSSGIGKYFIASILEANPAIRVCNISRSSPGIEGVTHFGCDLSDGKARHEIFPRVLDFVTSVPEPGKLLLVNNSGFGAYGRFPEPGVATHVEMTEVNIVAAVELTGLLLPELRRRGGAVINVASAAAFQPIPRMQTYAATKTFLLNWSVALAYELRSADVRVQALCPGSTRTGFHRRAGIESRTMKDPLILRPEQVVTRSFRALQRDRIIVVCGWLNRLAAMAVGLVPRGAAAHAARKIVGAFRPRSKS